MPSRANDRRIIEHLMRAASIGALAWMLWMSLDGDAAPSVAFARSGGLGDALREWTTSGIAPGRIAIRLDSAPRPVERDWLVAMRRTGSGVEWSGTVAESAISLRPVVSPKGGLSITVAAPESAVVTLSDELGAIDTVRASGGGARFAVPAATGVVKARVNGTWSRAALSHSAEVRRVLVVGAAGWESKFVIAALEEDGWKIDADIRIAPAVNVSQGATASIDTSRYAAVVVLDVSAATRAPQISAYVRSGGGVILAGRASSADGFALLRAGAVASTENTRENVEDASFASTVAVAGGPTTLRTLSLASVLNLRSDVVTLERRGQTVAVAARRHGAGRVLQHGYLDTWRWRMSGGESSVSNHRRWWTGAVASVAYVPRTVTPEVDAADPAPLAALTAALGPGSSRGSASFTDNSGSISPWWYFALLSVALLVEIGSRRLRAAR